MKILNQFKWSLLLIIIQFVTIISFTQLIPKNIQIPIIWNFQSEVITLVNRGLGLFLLLIVNICLLLFSSLLYKFKVFNKSEDRNYMEFIPRLSTIIIFYLCIFHVFMLFSARYNYLSTRIDFITFFIGLFLISLGNIFPKLPPNIVFGIKTHWSLFSKENWFKTHLIAGLSFSISGTILMIFSYVFSHFSSIIFGAKICGLSIILIPIFYSLFGSKKQK